MLKSFFPGEPIVVKFYFTKAKLSENIFLWKVNRKIPNFKTQGRHPSFPLPMAWLRLCRLLFIQYKTTWLVYVER